MKVRSDLIAGMTFEECDQLRNYWKGLAQGPCVGPPNPPQPSSCTGGYVEGVCYPDKSGVCG